MRGLLHVGRVSVAEIPRVISDVLARGEIVEEDLWVVKGDKVESFEGANNAIGTLVLRFQSSEELEEAITHQRDWLKVVVK